MKNKEFFCHELCKKCRGECCKTSGCALNADINFERVLTRKMILDILNTGLIKISKDKYTEILYLSIRNKNDEEYGECMLLSDSGCMFDDNLRPMGGVMLIPKYDENKKKYMCHNDLEKENLLIESWSTYQEYILYAWKHKKNIRITTKEELEYRFNELKELMTKV